MDKSRAQAVRLRMEQAHETLKEAETLQDHALWRGVINVPITQCSMLFWR
jgi:hypothetical protein